MFKKTLGTLALASLLITGFSVSQANAATPYVSESFSTDYGASFTTSSTDSTSVVVPENVSYFHTLASFNFTDAFLLAHAGQDLSYTVSVLDPSSNPLALQNGSMSNLGYSKGANGNLSKNGGWVSIDWQTMKLSIPADPTNYQGSYNPYVDISAANAMTGGKLAAGTYTINFTLFAGGSAISQETGLTVSNLDNSYFVAGNSFTVPQGSRSASISGTVCVDSTKVAVGDVLKAELYLDDTLSGFSSNYWDTRSSFKPQSDAGFRNNQPTSTATVTQYDITNGLGVRISAYYQNQLAVGSEHDLQFKLYNSTTNADVSGDCAPAKPATPTATYSNMSLRVSGTYSFGSQTYNVGCYAYDKSAPTVIAQTTFANSMMNSDQISCSFSGLSTGRTYFVRIQTSYDGKASALSDPSADVLVPAGGYTFTTNYAGTVAAGKVVKVSDNVLPIEDLASYTMTYSDGKGGIYTLGAPSTCNPMCGTSQARIRHFNGNYTLDSTFGGTGSIVLNSFSPSNPYVSGMGYYSTGKDKWVMAVSGYDSNQTDQKTQLIFGNAANATTTSKTLTKTDLNTACNAGAAGYGVRPSYTTTVGIYSAPVANPFLAINCYKQYTLADNSSQWLTVTVLATVDPATGALTVKGALGTPSANANGFSVRTSTNPDATGNDPMITAFVTSVQYTAYTNNTLVGTVADHSIIRISSNGTFLSTTGSAWGTSGGSAATDSYLSVASVNSGKIYGTLRAGMNTSLATFGATGVATTTAIDASASNIMGGIITMLGGYPIASNETLIPVSVNGMTELSAGWINATTGVLTVGEKLAYTSTPGNGSALIWLNGNDKNTYLLVSTSNTPNNLTVLKWIDSRYTVPTGPVPTVTSKDLKYSKNTPAAGTKVTLTGTNLNAVTSATIGGNAATLGTKSATSLQLTVPTAASAGTVDIVLTTADGPRTVDTFTYVGAGVQQDILIGAVASPMFVGGADLALSGTATFSPSDAGTAGAITWSSETPTICSIVSGKAHFLSAGVCTVTANVAASGLLLSGSRSTQTTVLAASQTITLTGPTNPEVDLDGIDLVASTTSGLPLTFATSTPGVCSVDVAAHVTAITTGDCIVTASQAGNGGYLAATQSVTITFVAAASTPVVDNGNPAQPTVAPKTGTWVQNGDTSVAWNRTKGTLGFKINVVYIGPIKATGVFKVGSKTYTCSVSFGILKKQATNKRLTLTSPNLCSGAKEKTQLAALKKAPANTVVKITFVRDMRLPTTYAKIRNKTRVIYVKLG
jgi:hypothetical protein